MKHTAFFGDADHTFALTDDMITELERITDLGIGALYLRTVNMQFKLVDLVEIIRLGLIGGGVIPPIRKHPTWKTKKSRTRRSHKSRPMTRPRST